MKKKKRAFGKLMLSNLLQQINAIWNLDIKSSLHFPQFCFWVSFINLTYKICDLFRIFSTLFFQRVLRVYNFYRKEGKVVSISAWSPPLVPGGGCDVNIVDAWYGVRTGAEWQMVGGSEVDTTADPGWQLAKWQLEPETHWLLSAGPDCSGDVTSTLHCHS